MYETLGSIHRTGWCAKCKATGKGKNMIIFAHLAKTKETFSIAMSEIQVKLNAWNTFYFAYKMIGHKTEMAVHRNLLLCADITSFPTRAFIRGENAINASTINIFPYTFQRQTGLKEIESLLKGRQQQTLTLERWRVIIIDGSFSTVVMRTRQVSPFPTPIFITKIDPGCAVSSYQSLSCEYNTGMLIPGRCQENKVL